MLDLHSVTGFSDDSRNIEDGFVFFVIKGVVFDGYKFIESAIRNGAKHIVLEYGAIIEQRDGISYHFVDDVRLELALFASRFYKEKPKNIVAVTGTNGKTSVVDFFRQICILTKGNGASIGTLGLISNCYTKETGLTTPSSVFLNKELSHLAKLGVDYVGIEASSHALEQKRLDGVNINVAAFTTLGHDHLDYHGSMEAYFESKLRLFNELVTETAVIFNDFERSNEIIEICKKRGIKIITYGNFENSDFFFKSIDSKDYICFFGNKRAFKCKENFQKLNLLCAIAMAASCGIDIDDICMVLDRIVHVPGRFEKVISINGVDFFVDFAHTPDAIEYALFRIRSACKGRVITIFGCGGNRDKSKRRIMGEIASKYSDFLIITDDNPRHEDPGSIRGKIISGIPHNLSYLEIADRKEAIRKAVELSRENDIVVALGKGHERAQIIGDIHHEHSDKDEIIKAAVRNS